MSNGRSFDPEIADVLLQAAVDGHYSYRAMVAIVHEQASRRRAEVLEEGGTTEDADLEHQRWAGFTISSVTRWKALRADFEAKLIEAGNQGAIVEAHATIEPLIHELREVAFDTDLSHAERGIRIKALGHMINARKHLATIRLDRRKTYHPETPALPATKAGLLYAVPHNPRFDCRNDGDVN